MNACHQKTALFAVAALLLLGGLTGLKPLAGLKKLKRPEMEACSRIRHLAPLAELLKLSYCLLCRQNTQQEGDHDEKQP